MGCSIECYRLRIGTFSQKGLKVKTGKSRPNKHNKVMLKKVAMIYLCWSIIYLLVFLSSSPQDQHFRISITHPSTRQKNTETPTKTVSSLDLDQKQVAFKSPYQVATKVLNKEVHAQNGNHSSRGRAIKICYWNKGSSFLINKTEDVKEIINT